MQWCQSISKLVRVHPRRRQQAWSIKFINSVWGGATTRVQGQNAWSGMGQSTPKTKDVQCNGQNMPTFCDTVILKKTKVSMENPASVFTSQAHQLSICTNIGNPAHPVRQPSGKNCQCENFRATRIPNKVRQGVKTKEQASWLFHEKNSIAEQFFAQFRMWCSHQDIQQHTIKTHCWQWQLCWYNLNLWASTSVCMQAEWTKQFTVDFWSADKILCQWKLHVQQIKHSLMYVRDRNRERQSVSVTSDYWIRNGKYNNYSENL